MMNSKGEARRASPFYFQCSRWMPPSRGTGFSTPRMASMMPMNQQTAQNRPNRPRARSTSHPTRGSQSSNR